MNAPTDAQLIKAGQAYASAACCSTLTDALAAMRAALAAQPAPAPDAVPLFWYRPCSDGNGWEGPIHDCRIERVRKESGAWIPLHTMFPKFLSGTCAAAHPQHPAPADESAMCPHQHAVDDWRLHNSDGAAPQPAPAAVPAGWALVPVKPTPAMLKAGSGWGMCAATWGAMLAAAPQQAPAGD